MVKVSWGTQRTLDAGTPIVSNNGVTPYLETHYA